MSVSWYDRKDLLNAAAHKIIPTNIVLDIGAGIVPQAHFIPSVHIIVEPYSPYIERLRSEATGVPRKVYLNGAWNEVMPFFPDKSVDTVFALDVIEHLTKDAGEKFLQEAERVARSQIVIFTPLGFYPQSYDADHLIDRWGMQGGLWQMHHSGWEPEDFGAEWDILACKEYHTVDQHDQLLDTPFGALWAIKSMSAHTAPADARYFISELQDDFLAEYVLGRLGERMLSEFSDDQLANYVRGRLGERLLLGFDDVFLAKYAHGKLGERLLSEFSDDQLAKYGYWRLGDKLLDQFRIRSLTRYTYNRIKSGLRGFFSRKR